MGQHGDLQPVLFLEVVHELLQRHLALDVEPVPQSPVRVVVLLDGGRDGLGKAEEGEGKVHEPVLEDLHDLGPGSGRAGGRLVGEGLEPGLVAHQLVELEAHEPGDQGRGRGDGRDDLAGDQFALFRTNS